MVGFLNAQPFGADLDFSFSKDGRLTGNFEVTLVETGELVYTAKRGNGVCKTDSKRHEIAVRIEDALEALEGK